MVDELADRQGRAGCGGGVIVERDELVEELVQAESARGLGGDGRSREVGSTQGP